MKKLSYDALDRLGRERLSKSFFMRDFLYSEIANFYGVPNLPSDPDLALAAGRRLCGELLEPLQEQFGRISIRSAFRSCEVTGLGMRSATTAPEMSGTSPATSGTAGMQMAAWVPRPVSS